MKEDIDKEIIEAVQFIKKNSPKLHLYVCAKLLEKSEKGSSILSALEARRTLGSIFHISRKCQLRILKELEDYKLILKINKKEYLIPINEIEYQEIFERK